MSPKIPKDVQFYKFCAYGFFKNLRFFDPFIMLFFREMGLSFLQIGLLFSIREVSINLLEIPTGVVADMVGRRRAMVTSFSSYLLSFSAFYLLGTSFWFCAAAMVLYAMGDTFRSGTHKAMILEYLKLKGLEHLKVDYYGRTRSCSQLGSAISSLIAAGLVFYSGSFRIVFLASTIPYTIDLLLMLTYPRELDGSHKTARPTLREFARFTRESFREIYLNLPLRRTVLNSSLVSASYKISKDYLQPILKSWAVALPVLLYLSAEKRTSLLVGVVYFFIFLLSSRASRMAGQFQRTIGHPARALNTNYLMNIFIYFLAGLAVLVHFHPLAVVAFLGIFIIQNFQRPMMVGYVGEVTDSRRMATMLSVENQSRAVWVALFSPVVGGLADRFGVGIALMGLGTILLLLFRLARVHSETTHAKNA